MKKVKRIDRRRMRVCCVGIKNLYGCAIYSIVQSNSHFVITISKSKAVTPIMSQTRTHIYLTIYSVKIK